MLQVSSRAEIHHYADHVVIFERLNEPNNVRVAQYLKRLQLSLEVRDLLIQKLLVVLQLFHGVLSVGAFAGHLVHCSEVPLAY